MKEQRYSFHIHNLHCANCAMKIETKLKQLEQVKDVSIALTSEKIYVNVEQEMDPLLLMKRLQNMIDEVEKGVVLSATTQTKTALLPKKDILCFGIGFGIYLFGLWFPVPSIQVFLFVIAYFICGYQVLLTAIQNIGKKDFFDENFLMAIATIGAFVIGSYEEAVSVMLFYQVGEIFQGYALRRSRSSISSLLSAQEEFAYVKQNDQFVKVKVEEVKVGDIIQVRVGDKVALDGTLLSDHAVLDTSNLTGESLPVDVKKGSNILSGSINLKNIILMKVDKLASESTISKILQMVEEANARKSKMERFISKFAKVYTPCVVIVAAFLMLIPVILNDWSLFPIWAYRSLTFLVVSCPCALVISIPLALYSGIAGASKQGILVKGGSYLEALCDVEEIVFDKTGTLTKGSFSLKKMIPVACSKEELLQIAAYGEYYSNHPIASCIQESYQKEVKESMIQNFEEYPGLGICVQINQESFYLGNAALMQTYHIPYEAVNEVGTVLYIASSNCYYGCMIIGDEIKPTSKQALQDCRNLQIKKYAMLSGDHQNVVSQVQKELNIEDAYAQLLPEDKLQKLQEIMEQNTGKTMFVGDGMNDAPVLAYSDVAVAMGHKGSDAAIEVADIVLMNDDLSSLSKAFRIAKKTKQILWQNIVFSITVKMLVLILTMFGYSSMWMGVFADVGVTLLAIANAMRAFYHNQKEH